ncbi:MAG: type VI secretion system protein TssR domain-containing protein [Bacteroidota bacterium]
MQKFHLIVLLLIPFLSLSTHILVAQNQKMARAKIQIIPQRYLNPDGVVVDDKAQKAPNSSKNLWVVFSDRDDNLTFETPSSNKSFKKIQFLDKFFVVDQEGEYVRIVRYEPEKLSGRRKNFISNPNDFGWIHQDKLLLWRSAMIDPDTRFRLKALTVYKAKALEAITVYNPLNIYKHPKRTSNFKNDKNLRLFQLFFICKRDVKNNSVLISRASKISSQAQDDILGWVDEDIVQLWKTRLCLEPNWDREAANSRKESNIRTTLLDSPSAAEQFLKTGQADLKNIIWDNDPFELKRDPNLFRMPVLEQYANGVIKTGIISPVFDSIGSRTIDLEEFNRIKIAYNRVREKARKFNIVLVIDGNTRMQSYFPTIDSAISSLIPLWKDSPNSYKLGSVVYNSMNDRIPVIEKYPTGNYRNVLSLFQSYVDTDTGGDDSEINLNLALALGSALRMFQRDETNILILIGESTAEFDVEAIARKIRAKACGLSIIQPANSLKPPQLNFLFAAKELLLRSQDPGYHASLKPIPEKRNTFSLGYPQRSATPGIFIHADSEYAFSPTQLSDVIREQLTTLELQHNEVLKALDQKMRAQGPRDVYVNEGMRRLMNQMEIPKTTLEKIRNRNYQLFIEGYTTMYTPQMNSPLYKYVLLMSESDLYRILSAIEKVGDYSHTPSELRENILDMYTEILIARFGDDKYTRRQIMEKSPGEILQRITGVPEITPFIGKYSIQDLSNKMIVADSELIELSFYLSRCAQELERNVIDNPQYFFDNSGQRFYWIDLDLLP